MSDERYIDGEKYTIRYEGDTLFITIETPDNYYDDWDEFGVFVGKFREFLKDRGVSCGTESNDLTEDELDELLIDMGFERIDTDED